MATVAASTHVDRARQQPAGISTTRSGAAANPRITGPRSTCGPRAARQSGDDRGEIAAVPSLLPPSAIRAVLTGVACLALMVGALVYMTDRPPAHAALMPSALSLGTGALFGTSGQWLPSFVHPFAFSLLCAALAPPAPRPAFGVCVAWWAVNMAFEAAQHPSLRVFVVKTSDAVFGGSAPTRLLSNYLARGTFDIGDLAAATLGALMAALMLAAVNHKGVRNGLR